jgi:hypothetical protein
VHNKYRSAVLRDFVPSGDADIVFCSKRYRIEPGRGFAGFPRYAYRGEQADACGEKYIQNE